MDKLNKLTDFHKRCIHNCISHVLACNYRSTHPDLTDDEVIARCRKNAGYTDNIEFTLADYCKAQKLDIKEVREFIDDVYGTVQFSDPESLLRMTDADWVAAFVNTQRCQNIPDICEILSRQGINCSVQRFKGIQRKHPEWTKEEVIGYVMLHEGHHTNKIYYLDVDNKRYTLTQICNKLGLNYNSIRKCVIENGEINIDKLLLIAQGLSLNILGNLIFTDRQLAIEVEETNIICTKTLKQMCEDANVKYETVRQFKWRHPNASNELAVKAVLQPDKLTVKDKCSIEGIPYKMVCRYKEYHKDVTHEQAIKAVKQKLEQKNS